VVTAPQADQGSRIARVALPRTCSWASIGPHQACGYDGLLTTTAVVTAPVTSTAAPAAAITARGPRSRARQAFPKLISFCVTGERRRA
jgi:hypothetical protein